MIPLYNCLFECLRRHARPQNSRITKSTSGILFLYEKQIPLVDLLHTLKFLRAFVPSIHLKNPNYSKVS